MASKDAPSDHILPMSKPQIFLIRMGVFLLLVVLVCILIGEALIAAFMGNLFINGLILAILAFAMVFCVVRVYSLSPEVDWINAFRRGDAGLAVPRKTSLLSPMAQMFRDRTGPLSLTPMSNRIILDSIGARLDESRENTRYLANLLIFLGILGTFWGLAQSVGSVRDVLAALSVGTGSGEMAFEDLQNGLEGPLSGLGTAVSSSLFGIGGSLIVGFLGLQAAQAQNRFYNEFEEWLSTITHLSDAEMNREPRRAAALPDGIDATVSAAFEAQSQQIDALIHALDQAERNRQQTDDWVQQAAGAMGQLDTVVRAQKDSLDTLAALAQDSAQTTRNWSEESLNVLGRLENSLSRLPQQSGAAPAAPAATPVQAPEGKPATLPASEGFGGEIAEILHAIHGNTDRLLDALNRRSVAQAPASAAPSSPVQSSAPAPAASFDGTVLDQLNDKMSQLLQYANRYAVERPDQEGLPILRNMDETLSRLLRASEDIAQAGGSKAIDQLAHSAEELTMLARGSGTADREILEALRSIGQIAHSLRENTEEGRHDLVQELRAEMKILTKTIAALIIESRRSEMKPRGER